jgi:hypothetical protein
MMNYVFMHCIYYFICNCIYLLLFIISVMMNYEFIYLIYYFISLFIFTYYLQLYLFIFIYYFCNAELCIYLYYLLFSYLLTLPLFAGVSRVRALSPAWTGSQARETLISHTHIFLPHDIPPTKNQVQ